MFRHFLKKRRLKNDTFWFRYIYPKNLTLFDNEKLVAPEISLGGNFSYDQKGEFYSTTTIYGYIKKEGVSDSYKTLMGILNSKLLWWYLVNTGTVLANGYFRFKPNYLKPFPLPYIPMDKSVLIESLVDEILEAKKQNNKLLIKEKEEQLNNLVYDIYSLSKEEIETINII